MPDNQNITKQIILDFLDYIRYKIENDRLTMDEADSIAKTIQSSMPLSGTADDFAKFYGKKEVDVRNVIHRNFMPKPVRRVYYDFSRFRKIVPKKWHHPSSQSGD